MKVLPKGVRCGGGSASTAGSSRPHDMSLDLKKARCFVHADREAVARCPMCEKFFCHECV